MTIETTVHCASCERVVALQCEGLSGVSSYPTYNEYACPYCRKQNHALTPGAIVSTRAQTV
jgi:DNA-directed RNA polymerase subunit RPC12/RpoP